MIIGMISHVSLSFLCAVVAALVLSGTAAPQAQRSSPCPKAFQYESVNEPGRWTGNLVLNSEDELHGVWLKLLFDNKLEEVTAEGYEVIQQILEKNEVLVKNGDMLLKAGSPTNVKITVKYDGDKFPNLIGYRLNAKTVCPETDKKNTDFFEGDDNAKDFLSTVLSKAKPTLLKPKFECGIKRSDVYPWQAAISLKLGGNDHYICEGTLISPSHVVIPAHCVTFRNSIDIIPEETVSVTLAGSQNKLEVRKIKIHRGYNPDYFSNDIALLELNSALEINDNVRPICIIDDNDIFEDESVIVGKVIGRDGRIQSKVAEASVEVTDIDDCATKNTQLADLLEEENSFCLSYLPKNSECVGNSGSNVVSFKDNIATLRGIVTLGPALQRKHCKADTTVVAIDVTNYYKWIMRSISELGSKEF